MEKYLKLTFVGDIMCQKELLTAFAKGNSFDFDSGFSKMTNLFKASDFICGNLETPISCENRMLTNQLYSYCSPLEFAKSVKNAGFGFVSTANNHCLDRGIEGINSTVQSLDSIGILHTGVFADKKRERFVCKSLNGVKIGFLSFTYGTNAFCNHNYLRLTDLWRVGMFQAQELSNPVSRYCFYRPGAFISRVYNKIRRVFHFQNYGCQVYERKENDWLQMRMVSRDIRHLKKQGVELIVCHLHIGGQYNEHETTHTQKIVNKLRKKGVNVIAGTHEHVVHGCSNEHLAENSVETYSLGNFFDTTGILKPPYDKKAEYSIVWHIYVDTVTKKIAKTSYTICKTILQEDNKKIEVVPVYDLLSNEADSDKYNQLWQDMQTIAYRFSKQKIMTPQLEYFC